ncbi:MAG: hypothetical protein EHM14_01610 [Methanothrix sp.]|nr:MAG: hypothetical protein EHM14_01610 [Methanothrix sp.]
MDEDEVLEKITRLLERGCTMLATHHDCGAPLFRCQGEVVCPVCSFADSEPPMQGGQERAQTAQPSGLVIPEEKAPSQELAGFGAVKKPGMQRQVSSSIPSATGSVLQSGQQTELDLGRAQEDLRAALLRKLAALTRGLEEEQDLDKLKKQLDCVEGLLKVFRSLS